MRTPPSSYEMLVSFTDGQLDLADRELLLTLLDLDADLSRQVWELRKLKDMVELSYAELPPPAPVAPHARSGWGWRVVTVMSVALLTFLSYWLFLGQDPAHRSATPPAAAVAVAAPEEMRILLHLTRYNRTIADELLTDVEYLLRDGRATGQSLRVEVVVNGRGLDLLRAGVTDFPERVRRLHREYGNLTFAACGNTLRRLERDTGTSIALVPEAVIVDSGVVEAVHRQRQGWVYIDV